MELHPKHRLAHELLATVYARFQNDPDKALYHLNLIINETGKGTANNYQVLGNIYAMKKDIPNAIEAFEKSLQIEPNNSNTLHNLGISYQQMGQLQKGQDFLNKAFELDPSLKR